MTKDIWGEFSLYLQKSKNIFDIMAAAYKVLCPFEPAIILKSRNEYLQEIVYCFSEQTDEFFGFSNLRLKLDKWIDKQKKVDIDEVRNSLFILVRLISEVCVQFQYSSRMELYTRYFSLNNLLRDEIIILPRFKSIPMKMVSDGIAKESGEYGFYGRNYARTADISGYIDNFIICRVNSNIRPVINIPWYYKELEKDLKSKNYKLKIGLFPLSDVHIKEIFQVKESIEDEAGLFDVAKPLENQEELLLKRCKKALLICKDNNVDIAVFPEMLLTEYIQNEVACFVRNNDDKNGKFPYFIWLGTAWSESINKCSVIDRNGNVVFEQNKYVPYEYKIEVNEEEAYENSTVIIRENLSHKDYWDVNFLDIPYYFRIATAICRDISSDYLTALLKELYSDMVIIPAFSKSNRLTKRKIETLALEHIIVVTCNACSALANNEKTSGQKIGEKLPFCYICFPAKELDDNAAVYHEVKVDEKCRECKQYCHGHIFSVSFSECAQEGKCYSAKVTYLST